MLSLIGTTIVLLALVIVFAVLGRRSARRQRAVLKLVDDQVADAATFATGFKKKHRNKRLPTEVSEVENLIRLPDAG